MVKSLCPLCLQYQDVFEDHHVVWCAFGGSDNPMNILSICKDCHAILTFGNPKRSHGYNLACLGYQRSCYGIEFEIEAYGENKRYGIVKNPNKSDYLEDAKKSGWNDQKTDQIIKRDGLGQYQLGMAIIHKLFPIEWWGNDDKIFDAIKQGTYCPLNGINYVW